MDPDVTLNLLRLPLTSIEHKNTKKTFMIIYYAIQISMNCINRNYHAVKCFQVNGHPSKHRPYSMILNFKDHLSLKIIYVKKHYKNMF